MTEGVASRTTLEGSVRASLAALGSSEARDQAAAALAVEYARSIDLGDDMTKLGPALLSCLAALLLTPAARASAMKGGSGASDSASPLDELRQRRARKRDAPAVDAATS